MGVRIRRSLLTLPLLLLGLVAPLAAQSGAVQGRLTDAESGQPLSQAVIELVADDGRIVARAITNADGQYRINGAPAGDFTLSVSAVGYGTQRLTAVSVADGATATADLTVAAVAFELNPLVVSASRQSEKALDAPAHVEIVSQTEIRARPAVTPVDHLRSIPGIDVITQGTQAANVVVRGFNNIFSGALHTLTDNRIAGVPSLRLNALHFVPTTDDDIQQMEVVLGPGAALYGPNTANGVLHIITTSPLIEQGTSISLSGGERSLFHGTFRTAQRLSDNFGVKVSGQYLRADEWRYADPVEVTERGKFDENLAFWRGDLMRAVGIGQPEADRRIARIGNRDFDVTRWAGDLRADWRLTPDATAVFAAGISHIDNQIELTGLGAAQARDWRYTYYQARFNWQRLFAQVYLNSSDAGDTFLLRNGAPIQDRSRLLVGQLQHGLDIGSRQRFTYGVDYLFTEPRTGGTINGGYEEDDETTEIGAYLQSETQLTPRLDLVLAGRIDDHSALPDPIFSPRAGLVFRPAEGHAFRATFNRAFSTPSSLNQFLDLGTAIPDEGAAQLGYSVRVQGTGTDGFRFQQDGSYAMRSPFNPTDFGGPAQLMPATNAANFWPAAVSVVAQQAAAAGQPLDPNLMNLLLSFQPSAAEIQPNFFVSTTGDSGPLSALDLPDLEPIRESTQTTFELGYKGILADRVLLSGDVWFSRRKDLVTPLTVQTPFVTLNPQDIAALIGPTLVGAGVTQAQIEMLVEGLASVPVGVISTSDINANGAQLLATYTNVPDEIDLWGVDLAGTFLISDQWSLSGSASFVNDDSFTTDRGLLVTLNAPKRKGSLGLAYRNADVGFNADARARFNSEYPASSGVYEGLACRTELAASQGSEPCVEAYTLLDLTVGYRLPGLQTATLQLGVQNLFDEKYRSFPGVPNVGHMAILKLRYDF